MGLFKKIGKAVKKGVKKVGSTAKKVVKTGTTVVKKVGKTVGKVASLSVGAVLLLPAIPLIPAMKKALKKKGFNTGSMSNVSVITKFYNEFVSKKNKATSNYDEIPDNYLEDHYLFKTPVAGIDLNEVAGMDVKGVVTAVVKFFKDLKDKKKELKESGKEPETEMSATESEMADDAQAVESQIVDKAMNEKPTTQGDMKQYIKYAVIAAIIILAIVIIMKAVRK